MGRAIAFAMGRLGFGISIVEPDRGRANSCAAKLDQFGYRPIEITDDIEAIKQADVVISAATYKANPQIAKRFLAMGVPYCDLGGDPTTSNRIIETAEMLWEQGSTASIFCDLGLAPGLVNIIAEQMVGKIGSVDTVKMRVGGLPMSPKGTLRYGLTWSIDGLRNEYSGECHILRDGQPTTVQALSEIEHIDFPELGPLESFHTKGGSAHSTLTMAHRGVKNCEYRTMRFPGHANLINFLLNECKLSDEAFNSAIKNACPDICYDQVLIAVDVDKQINRVRIIADEYWTAMQKATAFPTAAIAALVAEKQLPKKPRLDYADIPVDKMEEKLKRIGGFPVIFGE